MADWSTRVLVPCIAALSTLCCVSAINCFKCTSINHNNPKCEDTFNATDDMYEQDCRATREGRSGLFPGTQCIKMVAENSTYKVVVRNCVVDDGGTNSETEIGRQSHCGWMRQIYYGTGNKQVRMTGCILSCDSDGCNFATSLMPNILAMTLGIILFSRLNI